MPPDIASTGETLLLATLAIEDAVSQDTFDGLESLFDSRQTILNGSAREAKPQLLELVRASELRTLSLLERGQRRVRDQMRANLETGRATLRYKLDRAANVDKSLEYQA